MTSTPGPWPAHPVIHELDTWPWLRWLGDRDGRLVTLADVAAEDWDEVVLPGTDAVWLMGVWERSPAGRALAVADADLEAERQALLPEGSADDIVGSPYCIHRYRVDEQLGGPEGLAAARAALAARGARLLVDFVPNHVAPDHPWTTEHPEYFIRGDQGDLDAHPDAFLATPGGVLAMGRDPYFPPWRDVVQLNPFDPGLRQAVIATLDDLATQADGVRCDMAMLALDDVVERTWGERAGSPQPEPYWHQVIAAVRAEHPDFLFAAEAYWDREPDLVAQGFDHCYDKRLYDRLVHDDAASVRQHLEADPAYQAHLVRFLENHDEPRAAATFAPGRHQAAAVIVATTPGAFLLHQGQLAGRRQHVPVQFDRWPTEVPEPALDAFWRHLLTVVAEAGLRTGTWSALAVGTWEDNRSGEQLVVHQWEGPSGRHLVAVNFSEGRADGLVALPGTAGRSWQLTDLLGGDAYERPGDAMDPATGSGLYLALDPWQYQLFALTPA